MSHIFRNYFEFSTELRLKTVKLQTSYRIAWELCRLLYAFFSVSLKIECGKIFIVRLSKIVLQSYLYTLFFSAKHFNICYSNPCKL